MQQGVENVERILRLLAAIERPQFQSQKWPNFANPNPKVLLRLVQIGPRDRHHAMAGQGAIDARQDAGRNAVDDDGPLRRRRLLREKIHVDRKIVEDLFEPCTGRTVQVKPLCLQVIHDAAVLSNRRSQRNTQIRIECDRAR